MVNCNNCVVLNQFISLIEFNIGIIRHALYELLLLYNYTCMLFFFLNLQIILIIDLHITNVYTDVGHECCFSCLNCVTNLNSSYCFILKSRLKLFKIKKNDF